MSPSQKELTTRYLDKVITSEFIKTPARVVEVEPHLVKVKYLCNGRTRLFYHNSFKSHTINIIEETINDTRNTNRA